MQNRQAGTRLLDDFVAQRHLIDGAWSLGLGEEIDALWLLMSELDLARMQEIGLASSIGGGKGHDRQPLQN